MIKKILLIVNFMVLWFCGYSQAPGNIPYGEAKPVELNLFNIILFIVLPVLLIVFYIFYRRNKIKKEKKGKK